VATVVDDDARLKVRLAAVGLASAATSSAIAGAAGIVVAGVVVPRDGSGAAPDEGDGDDVSGDTGSMVAVGPAGAGELPIAGVVLDDRIAALGVAGANVWALHDTRSGDVTVLPLADLRRAAARRFDGLFLTGALEGK
jgi:hypothetical protein